MFDVCLIKQSHHFYSSLRGAVTNFDDNTENATWPLSSIGDLSYFLSNPTDQVNHIYMLTT